MFNIRKIGVDDAARHGPGAYREIVDGKRNALREVADQAGDLRLAVRPVGNNVNIHRCLPERNVSKKSQCNISLHRACSPLGPSIVLFCKFWITVGLAKASINQSFCIVLLHSLNLTLYLLS